MTTYQIAAAALLLAATPLAAKTFHITPSDEAQETIQLALIEAEPGDVVHLSAGTYALDDGLSLDVDGVTVRGDGPDATILSFKGQTGAGEGLLVTSDRVLLTGFAIEDTRGDAIKAKGSDRLTFDNLRAEWTNGPDAKNGAYGFYPVESTNILIQNSEVIACSDAGIYVGQSDNIVVRNNRVHQNVAGIEIENSTHADVYGNFAFHNTGGILVFDLPDLPMVGGHSTRIYDNVIVNNDTPNFASPGNIVAGVPQGLGIMVMANRNVHIFNNFLDGNSSAHVMIVGYTQEFTDERYNPLARDVVVRDNVMARGGYDPKFDGGAALAAALGGAIPDVMWDGSAAFMRGDAKIEEAARMSFDAPAVSLNLAVAGADVADAQPSMASARASIAEPAPVMLPEDQPGMTAKPQLAMAD
ncbi:right-handed parallel beta-helix repeat-containing protein [Pacificimonas sp. WHA3]|uniref:Right-handed parallel beta-helix repeat-containing protein n=1 Tax=Pacificimonas pallii TaxID=2827236 RepID=A0ABS6SBJ4_9SPHN|nr:parallel beta-helix domain-containing protein [Pacificimonas pallii]MBV7255785.1 right-handed parallel beta-helix repeat-containing protein [Pacificimonas pallii]